MTGWHAFTCVLALTLTSLLQRCLHQKGIDLSMPRMYDLLGGIRETLVIYPRRPGEKNPRVAAGHSTLSDEQQKLFDALDLKRYFSAQVIPFPPHKDPPNQLPCRALHPFF